jgi:nucleoside-diphosphate-sugar epimerase
MDGEAALDARLSEPQPELIDELARLDGDVMVLGVGGKMGPTLASMARRAFQAAGLDRRVIGVARFSRAGLRDQLAARGVETVAADLMDRAQLESLPDVPNVVFMAGTKFGTSGAEHMTWAVNAFLPGLVAERFASARTVVFSTGNVYPLTPVSGGGAAEDDPTGPLGEYAQSCLARERVFEHASRTRGTPVTIFRLNYAIDLRYGVLLDIAQAVREGRPVDVSMPAVNVIWQGDACAVALRSLGHASSPPLVLNVTGPETASVRRLARRFGELLGIEPVIVGEEGPTALLSNSSRAHRLFGYPRVTLGEMVEWTASWVQAGGPTLAKPTHFEEREGRF